MPVALELAVELTRSADGSAAILWFSYVRSLPFRPDTDVNMFASRGNLFGIIFVLGMCRLNLYYRSKTLCLSFSIVEGAMRASDSANPPKNLHNALIFQGAFVLGLVGFILLLHGEQKRRRADEQHANVLKDQVGLMTTPPPLVSS